eukprot:3777500-Pleurochrysis_carterae.AAC.1
MEAATERRWRAHARCARACMPHVQAQCPGTGSRRARHAACARSNGARAHAGRVCGRSARMHAARVCSHAACAGEMRWGKGTACAHACGARMH